jgi:endogenous inhibitor of DNA gyrase (YacG/DUF329 family)
MSKIVKCPTCQKQVEWTESSSFRPFCSDRCRLIDLGDWASEKHAIADEPLASSEETLYFKNDKPDKF